MTGYGLYGPLLRCLPPEAAHRLSIHALRAGLVRTDRTAEPASLATELWGRRFPNPVGLAAGFDKDAEVPRAAFALGIGFAECGTVTPKPQAGNPRPRLFRLPGDRAVINRMGFNNGGHAAFEARMRAARSQGPLPGPVGINIGRNKDTDDEVADYLAGLDRLHGLADYMVVNISSPNTPGLRALQTRDRLDPLVAALMEKKEALGPDAPPLLLKLAPDLEDGEIRDIAAVARAREIDGLILTNTTLARPESLASPHRAEQGGLSGAPLMGPSTDILRTFYRETAGDIPLIGCGGIASGADAYAKIRAGASLVQLYTALVYEGPGLIGRIKRELTALLARDGLSSIQDAVGRDSG